MKFNMSKDGKKRKTFQTEIRLDEETINSLLAVIGEYGFEENEKGLRYFLKDAIREKIGTILEFHTKETENEENNDT